MGISRHHGRYREILYGQQEEDKKTPRGTGGIFLFQNKYSYREKKVFYDKNEAIQPPTNTRDTRIVAMCRVLAGPRRSIGAWSVLVEVKIGRAHV